jgi:CDP-diacylglycerol---glycerol-3-phosphate 3-phosphatidyltransferase
MDNKSQALFAPSQIPNALTLSRLLFLPAVAWFFQEGTSSPGEGWVAGAFLLVVLAVSTDWVDGFVARRYGWVSNFGKIADPLVDKVLVLGLFAVLLLAGELPVWGWVVVAVTFGRDVLVTILRARAAKAGTILAAGSAGKWKTAIQMGGLLVLFAVPALRVDGASLMPATTFAGPLAEVLFPVGLMLFAFSGLLAVSSGWGYLKAYRPSVRPGQGG